MKRVLSSLLLVCGVLVAEGCAYVSADGAELTKTVRNDPQLSFAGMGELAGAMMSDTRMISANIGKGDLLGLPTRAELLSLKFAPESGVSSLQFVRSAKVHLPAQGVLPEVLLADYVATVAPQTAVDMRINHAFDHTEYFKNMDPLQLRVTMEVAAPEDAWSASLELTLALESSGQVSF